MLIHYFSLLIMITFFYIAKGLQEFPCDTSIWGQLSEILKLALWIEQSEHAVNKVWENMVDFKIEHFHARH